MNFNEDDIFIPGLISLMIHGYFMRDWTLFQGMTVVPPDCVAVWNGHDFDWKLCFTVKPTDEHWADGWDDLVDEMYALSKKSIEVILKSQPKWLLPLSS